MLVGGDDLGAEYVSQEVESVDVRVRVVFVPRPGFTYTKAADRCVDNTRKVIHKCALQADRTSE